MDRAWRVVIAEERDDLRKVMRHLVAKRGVRTVVGEYARFEEALKQLQPLNADILSVALNPERRGANAFISAAQRRVTGLKVIAIADSGDTRGAVEAAVAGADACLLLDELGEHLAAGLAALEDHQTYLGPGVVSAMLTELRHKREADGAICPVSEMPLSPREHEVLQGLVDRKGYKQIGMELKISSGTARWYANQARAKLRVESMPKAIQPALFTPHDRAAP